MREVYINNQQVDVNQEDAVDIIYESPIFSDISKIKSNTTTTYRLPKTDRNLAIFHHADQHDVKQMYVDDSGQKVDRGGAYSELRFDEYRNGLPIIQNGRCRLLKIADHIELAVVWGTKVPLSEKLNIKMTELDDHKKEEDKLMCLWNSDFIKYEKDEYPDIGMLYANFGIGFISTNMHPSVTVHKVFDLISERIEIPIEYEGFEETFKKRWLPCLTKKMDGIARTQKLIELKKFEKLTSNCLGFDSPSYFPFYEKGDLSSVGRYYHNYRAMEKGKHHIKVKGYIKTGSNFSFSGPASIKFFFSTDSSFKNGVIPTFDNIKGYADFELVSSNIPLNRCYISMDKVVELEKGEKIYMGVYFERVWNNNTEVHFLNIGDGDDEMQFEDFTVSIVNTETVLFSTYFPIAKNLPDITCLDFIKTICAMYGLFPHYDFKEEKLKLLSINGIYGNKENAKCWDNKVIDEVWTIERTFGDYAQRNILNYEKDETVKERGSGFLVVENTSLSVEKELITLKFAASDEVEVKNSGYEETNVAKIPIYELKEGDFEYKSIKPRILSEGVLRQKSGEKEISYRSLSFNSSMKFDSLIKEYYSEYQSVVRKPVIRDLVVLLSDIDLMNISPLDIIYLRGKYWMPIKIQVDTDGKAKSRLILLPDVV